MPNIYLSVMLTRRMARLGIIGKEAETEFIETALNKELTRLEQPKEEYTARS